MQKINYEKIIYGMEKRLKKIKMIVKKLGSKKRRC
jgi:hypothetical protein